MTFERWVGKLAIVTGASAGIGAAVVEKLVREGVNVIGIARRIEKLEELSRKLAGEKAKFYPVKCDVGNKDDVLNTFEWIRNNFEPVHILINNAGIGPHKAGGLSYGDIDEMKKILDVNVMGMAICIKETVQDMKRNNVQGHLIQMNSLLGHKVIYIPDRDPGIYPPSKHAVTAMNECLRLELASQKCKIKLTSISPSVVKTEISPSSFYENKLYLNAEDVADAVYYVLSTPPNVEIQELIIRHLGELF